MSRPRIFLSAVSEELRTARQVVAATVRTLGFDPVSQDDFPTGHGELRLWLRDQINSCEGLVQIIGFGYGVEPPEVDADYGRVSYTQFEFLYARLHGKKTWLIIVGEQCHRDTPLERLDLPRDPACLAPAGYQMERRQLQQAYIARLRAENHLRHHADTDTELENVVLRLRDELGELRRRTERHQSRLVAAVVIILFVLVLLGGGGWWAYKRLHTSVQQVAAVNTEKIRVHLRRTVEETHHREIAEADMSTDWKQRRRLREAAEAAHTARLRRIDELAASFADIEGNSVATSVLQEMTRILTDQGVDEAITYVASKRSAIIQTVKARAAAARDRNRADLQPLLQAAGLHESKGQPTEARSLYTDVLNAEPDWSAALQAFFNFLVHQGDDARIHTTLGAAGRGYDDAYRLALRLTVVDPSNTEWQRDLWVSQNRLGEVAAAQGKLDDAAQAYGNGLAILKKLVAGDASNIQWQRDLSVSYNLLGNMAVAQGKLDEATRAYGDGLAIAKKLATGTPQWQHDLSVFHTALGDVARVQGKLDAAARAYGEGLAIRKELTAGDPSNTEWQHSLAGSCSRLGYVALEQGKLDVAARAYGDGLAIVKRLAADDPSNTEWQRDLLVSYERLGDVAWAQKKLGDAVRAYGDGLTIREKLAAGDPSNTEWQRDLSVSYNKLGDVARAQGKADAAARAYGESNNIFKKLAAGDPSNTKWQRDLAISQNNLGSVAQDLDAAERAYGESNDIFKKLAAGDPSNAEWQRDLWVSYVKLADLAERRKKSDEAQGYWKQALDALSGIEKRGLHLSPEDRKVLNQLRQKAAAAQ